MFDFEDDDNTPSTEYVDLMEAEYRGKKFVVYVKNDTSGFKEFMDVSRQVAS